MGVVARGDAAVHAAVYDDRRASGYRPCTGRHGGGGIFPERDRPRADHHERLASLRYRRRVRRDPADRPDRRRPDATRPEDRAALRALEAMMSQAGLAALTSHSRPAAPAAGWRSSALLPRIVCGIVLLATWEAVVRLFAPAYVAKPTAILAVIPQVFSDPKFFQAVGVTLLAVAEGLAIALAFGVAIGLAVGRFTAVDRALRHYVNGFYAVPMIIVLPLFS